MQQSIIIITKYRLELNKEVVAFTRSDDYACTQEHQAMAAFAYSIWV